MAHSMAGREVSGGRKLRPRGDCEMGRVFCQAWDWPAPPPLDPPPSVTATDARPELFTALEGRGRAPGPELGKLAQNCGAGASEPRRDFGRRQPVTLRGDDARQLFFVPYSTPLCTHVSPRRESKAQR